MSGDIGSFYNGSFNPEDYESLKEFSALPPGEYPVVIESAEVKANTKQTGHYLKLVFAVISEDEYKNRKIFGNINIQHQSEKAQEIGQRELATLGKAVGIPSIANSTDLLGLPLLIKVKVVNDAQRGDSNEITNYKPLEGYSVPSPDQLKQPPAPPVNNTATDTTPAPGAGGTPPWMKNR